MGAEVVTGVVEVERWGGEDVWVACGSVACRRISVEVDMTLGGGAVEPSSSQEDPSRPVVVAASFPPFSLEVDRNQDAFSCADLGSVFAFEEDGAYKLLRFPSSPVTSIVGPRCTSTSCGCCGSGGGSDVAGVDSWFGSEDSTRDCISGFAEKLRSEFDNAPEEIVASSVATDLERRPICCPSRIVLDIDDCFPSKDG